MAEPIVSTTWQLDRKGIQEIATSREMGDEMVKRASKGVPLFEAIAPVQTGQYRTKVRVRRRIERISGMRRQTARLESRAYRIEKGRKFYYGWAVEWGNGAHHTLGHVTEMMRGQK